MFKREPKVILDEDFQQIFKPFYYIQYVYCMQAFNIKKNYATPITKKNLILAVIIIILIIVLFYRTIRESTYQEENASAVNLITYYQYVQSFILITFINFYQNKLNFQLLVKLQELCRRIGNAEDTKRLKIMAWACCSALVVYYVGIVTVKLSLYEYWHWARAAFIMMTIVFEVKLTNVALILYFLILKLRKWRKVLRIHMIEGTDKEVLNDLKCTFEIVISVFTLFKKTYQSIVLIHFVMTFFHSLFYIEILIISLKTSKTEYALWSNHVMGVVSWIVKGVVIEIYLSVICECFYSEVESNRDEIIKKTGSKLRRLCDIQRNKDFSRFGKCVLRITKNEFTRMSACGVFTVDLALPLRLAGLLATYALVLLQFAQ